MSYTRRMLVSGPVRPLLAALVLLAACSPAPPAAPPPAVNIAPPPAPSSAAPAPTAAPSAAEPEAGDAATEPEPDCESQIAEAKSASHSTFDDCMEMQQRLVSLYQTCPDSPGDAVSFAILEAAECVEDVLGEKEAKLHGALSAPIKTKVAAAQGSLKGEIGGFCTRDCGVSFGAHCTMGVLSCKMSAIEAAQTGTLDFEKPDKIGKATHVFDDQAAALCALPASAWKDGKAPAGCVNRVLSWLQGCGDPAQSCPNP